MDAHRDGDIIAYQDPWQLWLSILDTRVTLIAVIKKSHLLFVPGAVTRIIPFDETDRRLRFAISFASYPHRKRASFGEEVLATENVNDARWAFAPSRLFFLSRAISTPSAAADPQKQSFF
jgi:hypothetical protein